MKAAEIKIEKELMFEQIRKAEERLAEIRKICKHENTFEGNWSYGPGRYFLSEICSDCGDCLKSL